MFMKDYAQHLEDMMPQNTEEIEEVEPLDFSGASEDPDR